MTRKKSQTEIEIPRIGIKVQSFLGLFYLFLFLVSSFCMFVIPFLIPRFKFLHVCSTFPYSSFQVFACLFYISYSCFNI